MTDLLALSADDFEPHSGTAFRFTVADDVTLDATLVDVVARRGDTVKDAQRGPFSVLFRVVDGPAFEQGMVRVEHDALGTLLLFLVPVAPDGEGHCYEATFS